MKVNLPAPQWPHDPYTRTPISINAIKSYARKFVRSNDSAERKIPEKLELLINDFDVNEDKWQRVFDSGSPSSVTNALRAFYIEKGVYEPTDEQDLREMTEDEILWENPLYHFVALLSLFLENYNIMFKDYISPETFERIKPMINRLLRSLNENNRPFTRAFNSIREQLHEIDNQFDDENPQNMIELRDAIDIDSMVHYLMTQFRMFLPERALENLEGRLYDWIPVIISALHDQIPMDNVRLILEFIKSNITSYDNLYIGTKALFENIQLENWLDTAFDYSPLIDAVIQAFQDEGVFPEGYDIEGFRRGMSGIWEELTRRS